MARQKFFFRCGTITRLVRRRTFLTWSYLCSKLERMPRLPRKKYRQTALCIFIGFYWITLCRYIQIAHLLQLNDNFLDQKPPPYRKAKLSNFTKVIYRIPSNDTMPPYGLNEGFMEFKGCWHSDCYYTEDKDFFGKNAYDKFDAILFTVPSFRSDKTARESIPTTRKPSQRYIMTIREAPWPHMYPPWINHNYFSENFFNWTWTYRSDSDLANPLSWVIPRQNAQKRNYVKKVMGIRPNKMPHKFTITGKKKLVFWVVSNCHTHSRREDYVKIMQKYIDVDVYGACGPLKCKGNGDSFFPVLP